MPDVFFTSGGRPRAVASIRRDANGQPQSLNASIPDGDTIAFHAEGSGSVRFLGIDSPENRSNCPARRAHGVLMRRNGKPISLIRFSHNSDHLISTRHSSPTYVPASGPGLASTTASTPTTPSKR